MLLLTILLSFAAAQAAAPAVPARAEAVVKQLTSGQFEAIEPQFTDQMKAALPPGKLGETWKTMLGQVGAFQKQTGAREEQSGSFRIGVVTCVFERATLDVRVVYDTAGRIAGLNMRPAVAPAAYTRPPYADPAAFTESDVTVGGGEWALPGTLTLPKGDGPFPALVLIHGSGPNDRDETIGPQKPFADLAGGLASRGVAVLRFDKRTKVYGAKLASASITVKDEVVDDAVAAVAAARASPRVDRNRVFVLGHSLGGMLIPRIAAADPSIAGFVVMAGAARPLERAILEQIEYLAKADGTVSPDEQKAIDDARRSADEIQALTPADAAGRKAVSNVPASYWLDLRGYDPPAAAKAITKPMLVLQGERDYQVTMDEFARWKAALGSKPNATLKSYPPLNHLMMPGAGKSLPLEYETPNHVAQDVVDDIAMWLKSQSVAERR